MSKCSERIFHFVDVDNFDGSGSGPGYSLLCCKKILQESLQLTIYHHCIPSRYDLLLTAAHYILPKTNYQLLTTYYLLPTTYYRLPTTYHLPATYYLPPTICHNFLQPLAKFRHPVDRLALALGAS